MRRFAPLFAALVVLAAPASAQEPVAGDTVGRDTSDVTRLPDLNVTVTRSPEPLARVPFAVGVLNRDDLVRGQATLGIDEALNNLPGVVVANRYNFSLDQRISIRGFGSRSNFGVRGLKILLDGIPQTLPDGQSQLTNMDFADIERAEVLRGSSSSLYGNASGGVIAFQTRGRRPDRSPSGSASRAAAASGTATDSTSGRAGRPGAPATSAARCRCRSSRPTASDSTAPRRSASSTPALTTVVSGSTIATLRAEPGRQSGGAEPGRADPGRIRDQPRLRRGQQHPPRRRQRRPAAAAVASACGTSTRPATNTASTLFGLLRDLANPLAAPRISKPGPTAGTYIAIDRQVGGVRLSAARALGSRGAHRRGSWPAPTCSGCGTTGRTWSRTPACRPRRLSRPAGEGDRARTVRPGAVEPRTSGCC